MENNNKKTILIVDDAPENINILSELLSDYNRKIAVNGKMALKAAEKTLPDLILLDVMMPEMDGFETAKRLKANAVTAHIPVIFITAVNNANTSMKEFDLDDSNYIRKPFEPDVVISKVKRILENK